MFKSLFNEAKERKRLQLEAEAAKKVEAEAKSTKKPERSDEKKPQAKAEKPPKKKETKRKREEEPEEKQKEIVERPPKKKAKIEPKKQEKKPVEEAEEEVGSQDASQEDDSDASVLEFDDDGYTGNDDLTSAIREFIDSGGLGVSSDEEEPDENESEAGDEENEDNDAAEAPNDRTKTVFVGNLPLDTTQNQLKTHFEAACGRTVSIQILPAKAGKTSTLAFVEFRSKAALNKALKLDGSQYKGRRLLCSLARDKEERTQEAAAASAPKPDFSAFIKNLSQETTTDGLKTTFEELCGKGKVSTVRIPVNTTTGRARGYGFVEFVDQKALDQALKAKKMTLDGRTILIEHAATKKKKQD